jgi:hypothetical protein
MKPPAPFIQAEIGSNDASFLTQTKSAAKEIRVAFREAEGAVETKATPARMTGTKVTIMGASGFLINKVTPATDDQVLFGESGRATTEAPVFFRRTEIPVPPMQGVPTDTEVNVCLSAVYQQLTKATERLSVVTRQAASINRLPLSQSASKITTSERLLAAANHVTEATAAVVAACQKLNEAISVLENTSLERGAGSCTSSDTCSQTYDDSSQATVCSQYISSGHQISTAGSHQPVSADCCPCSLL